ncbi:MAG TPA: TIGR00730 family Rossman fold protein [Ktedonosporobacter sp.]|nr:TIGR00730 family Rossman fold protein [Ktedonosporobacter sp.]
MRRICVFTGSNKGLRQEYEQAARSLGQELAARELALVYGGASVGLMGAVADAALQAGGEVIGVIPRGLFKREVGHDHLTELIEVGSMHERKALMADLSDGFIALPGGFGTFDELFEITTWAQIGIHHKPIGILNVAEYFAPLQALIEHAVREGFVPSSHTQHLLYKKTPIELLDAFATFVPPPNEAKWTELPPAP